MQQEQIIKFPQYRKKSNTDRTRKRLNAGKVGRIYARGVKLWVDFHYLGQRVREPSGLKDTAENRKALRYKLDLIIAEIENGIFEFAKRFPHSRKKEHFSRLERHNRHLRKVHQHICMPGKPRKRERGLCLVP